MPFTNVRNVLLIIFAAAVIILVSIFVFYIETMKVSPTGTSTIPLKPTQTTSTTFPSSTTTQTMTVTGWDDAVRLIISESENVEVKQYTMKEGITFNRGDVPFGKIVALLNSTKVIHETLKTKIVDNNTVSVTIPYVYDWFLTFRFRDSTPIRLDLVEFQGTIWFETETTIYEVSVSHDMILKWNEIIGSATSTSSGTSVLTTTCTITGQSAGATVRVLSDAGSPIAGVQISGTQINPCGNAKILPVETDSNGLITLPGKVGTYNMTLTYEGLLYNVNIPMYPVQRTEVTLYVPSGIFSIEVIPYGDRPGFSGPSFITTSGGLQLKVTLGSYAVQAGEFQPIRIAFLGSGAWNASYAEVNVAVSNSVGENVWDHTERTPSLYSIPYTNLLQEFICYNGWIPRANNVQVTPGEYTMVLTVNIDSHLLRVQGNVRVI